MITKISCSHFPLLYGLCMPSELNGNEAHGSKNEPSVCIQELLPQWDNSDNSSLLPSVLFQSCVCHILLKSELNGYK